MRVINLGAEVGCMISEGPWVFVGMPNFVKAWNTETNTELSLSWPIGEVYAMVVGNGLLFAGTQDGSILAWTFNAATNCFEPAASLNEAKPILLCSSNDNSVHLYDFPSWVRLACFLLVMEPVK
ncbi:hypothetical protein F2P56_011057 [Juglans regia]|uniref:Uncharacterized protein n=1 Tax=Juglans regia TaxID=51240 RepID=A0A834D048_JUGRE|nr:hypothetical protein F2P56_011057 [Juglans regia]